MLGFFFFWFFPFYSFGLLHGMAYYTRNSITRRIWEDRGWENGLGLEVTGLERTSRFRRWMGQDEIFLLICRACCCRQCVSIQPV